MSEHDPLCDNYAAGPIQDEDEFCHCELIRQVREDERKGLSLRTTSALVLLGKSGDITPQGKRTIQQILEEEQ